MDVLDQAFAPGAPALVPGGMTSLQLFEMLLVLGGHPKVRALDIVEVDPSQDPRRATVRVAVHAMLTFLTGLALRRGDA
jgi:formiminoglutamase